MDGETLKAIRDKRAETQTDFAALLNEEFGRKYDGPKISRWESGAEKIPADVAGFVTLCELRYRRPEGHKARVITLASNKGGIGKTAVSVNLAYTLARIGGKVLLVDADSQGNSTLHVGIAEKDAERLDLRRKTLYDALVGNTPLRDVIHPTGVAGLEVVPSYTRLAAADVELSGEHDTLRDKLSEVADDYDFVVVDCGPSLGAVTLCALTAASYVLAPVQTEPHSIVGLARLFTTINQVKRSANRELEILGVVPTMHSPRITQCKDSLLELYQKLSSKMQIFTAIPRASVYPTAAAANMITLVADRNAPGLGTFLEIANALMERQNGTQA